MDIRIYTVQSMGQNRYCGKMVSQCCTMGMNINAISQATHNQDIGTGSRQITKKVCTKLFAIFRSITGAYHINNAKTVEISITLEE